MPSMISWLNPSTARFSLAAVSGSSPSPGGDPRAGVEDQIGIGAGINEPVPSRALHGGAASPVRAVIDTGGPGAEPGHRHVDGPFVGCNLLDVPTVGGSRRVRGRRDACADQRASSPGRRRDTSHRRAPKRYQAVLPAIDAWPGRHPADVPARRTCPPRPSLVPRFWLTGEERGSSRPQRPTEPVPGEKHA